MVLQSTLKLSQYHLRYLSLSVFSLCILPVQKINADCATFVAQAKLDALYPLSLSLELNDVFNSHYGEGSKIFKLIIDKLGLSPSKGARISDILKPVFAHLHLEDLGEMNSAERFFKNYLPHDEKKMLERTLFVLDARFSVLENFLSKNPLRGDSRLLASYMHAILNDWNPNTGFSTATLSDIAAYLEIEKKLDSDTKAAAARKDEDSPTLWQENALNENSTGSAPRNSRPKNIRKPAPLTPDPQIILYDWENASEVTAKLEGMKRLPLDNIKKPKYPSFEVFDEIEVYHYLVAHLSNQKTEELLTVYNKGLLLVIDQIINPKDIGNPDLAEERMQNFFGNMSMLLEGTQASRFGDLYTEDAKNILSRNLHELNRQLLLKSELAPLLGNTIAIYHLNVCLNAVGIDSIDH